MTKCSCSKITILHFNSHCSCTRGARPPPFPPHPGPGRLEPWQHLNTFHTGLSKGGRADTRKALGHRCGTQRRAHLAPTSGQRGGRQTGGQVGCSRPAETIHTSFSSSAAFGVMHRDVRVNTSEYIRINNNHGKPGQPAMKVTRCAIHSDSVQLRQA